MIHVPKCHPERPYLAREMCNSCYARDYRKRNPRGSMKSVPRCHPERPYHASGLCKSCYLTVLRRENPILATRKRGYEANWKKRNPDYHWSWALQHKYHITQEAYLEILRSQDERCAICKTRPYTNRRLNVDHDHKSASIRGLLCDKCNLLIGKLENNANLLPTITGYLKARH
jgi:hypothetical protein